MSQEELIDIVNEKDEVIGTILKSVAHEKGVLHRTVIGEVINLKGEWTLVKQAPDRQDPGQYVSPVGGHVQAGESEDEALIREAAEEFGLRGKFDFRLKGKKIFNRQVRNKQENHYFILYEILTDEPPVLNEESVGFENFTLAKLKAELKANPKKFGDAFHFVINSFYPELVR